MISASAGIYIEGSGVTTTAHMTIAGPVVDPEKTFSQVNLIGTAQAVGFQEVEPREIPS